MHYIREDGKKNGIGIAVETEMNDGVLHVNRKSDTVMWLIRDKG